MSVNQLKQDVIDELHWDSRVNAEAIQVEINSNGVIELKGKVPSYTAKRAAEQDAKLLSGVSSVVNELEVLFPSSVKPPKDDDIFSRVLNILRSSSDINSEKIDISVESGFVTLRGIVDSYWKKIKAENIVSDINNVIDVNNELKVEPQEKRTDKDIAEDIYEALGRSVIVNIKDIVVTVKKGVVELSGTLKNWKTHNSIIRAVTFTNGVKEIKNDLLIKSYL